MVPGGFSASPAYDFWKSDNDLSEGPTSHGDIELTIDQTLYPDITPKASDKTSNANPLENGVGTVPSSTKGRRSSATSTQKSRPDTLQQTAPVSAPEVPQRMAGKGSPIPKKTYQTRRAVSQGQPRIPSQELDQNASSLPGVGVMDNSTETALPSSNKRRRSDQGVAQKSFDNARDLLSAQIASSPTLALPSNCLPSRTRSPRSKTSGGTSQYPDSGIDTDLSLEKDQPSEMSSHGATESSQKLDVPRLGTGIAVSDLSFELFYKERISAIEAAHEVFETMQAPLCEEKDLDVGYIYALRMVGRPDFVKIGRTKHPIKKRLYQISLCFAKNYTLEIISDRHFCAVERHTKVEKLIHDELRNYRRSLSCPCKQKKHDGEVGDGLTKHSEWFEIKEAKAIEVINRWRKWMMTKPYEDGSLKQNETLRINMYNRDPDLMDAMTIEIDSDWSWHIFMRNTFWLLQRLWLYEILFGERFERSTCSPWDSLWKHWKSNVLFCVVFFGLSCVLSVVSSVLSSSAFPPIHAVLSTLILGSGAVLYAA